MPCTSIKSISSGNDSWRRHRADFRRVISERVRSLTLTDCDTHDNWPPEAFKSFLAMAAAGGLRGDAENNVVR